MRLLAPSAILRLPTVTKQLEHFVSCFNIFYRNYKNDSKVPAVEPTYIELTEIRKLVQYIL